MVDDEVLGIKEAAERCGLSEETIRRRLKAGRFVHARRESEPNGAWLIPLADLIAAGLQPFKHRVVTPAEAAEELGLVRGQLVELGSRCARAEALAEARAEHITDLRGMLALGRAVIR
jgi:UDP-N-acetylmuramyl pentapeptide synthase